MFQVSQTHFKSLVQQALESLPPTLQAEISNLEIVVKDSPSKSDLRRTRSVAGESLFGLYQGIPLTRRDTGYDKVLPDLIIIYQRIHEEECDNLEALEEIVRQTVRHEIAHHFGIDDDRLEELGAG